MPSRKCCGFAAPSGEVEPCRFHPSALGQPAQGKFAGRCVWCWLRRRLADSKLTGLLVCALAAQAANPGAVRQLLARARAERQEEVQEKVRERLGEGAEIQEALADAAAEAENFMEVEPEDAEERRPVDPGSDSKQSEKAAACYYEWRGGLVYDIYRRMGGSRSHVEVSELFDQEIDVSEYKDMVGGWMKTLLEAEGQAPSVMVLDILKHPVGRMTREKWAACLAADVDEASKAEASEDDLPRAAAPRAWSDSERSRDEADEVPGKQPRPFAFLERFVGPGLAAAAAVVCRPGPLRRPAARAVRPNERCPGEGGRLCSFSTTTLGAPAAVHPRRGQLRCLFCSDEHLDRLLAQQSGFQVTKCLLAIQAMSQEKSEECLENLRRRRGDALASAFRTRVLRATKRREQKAAPEASPADKWKDLLAARQRPAGELEPEDAAAWEETVRRDRMRICRKVFCPDRIGRRYNKANEQEEIALAPPASDAAPNDCGLPSPDISKRAEMAENWCKFGSWQMCQTCHSMRPRPFWPGDLKRVARPTVKRRGLCQRGVKVPQPGDIPEPLQGLSREVVAALRPLDIDTGAYDKVAHGYRAHSSMIRFAWSAKDVEDKIAALKTRRQRKRARRAFRCLLEDDSPSAYMRISSRSIASFCWRTLTLRRSDASCHSVFWRSEVWSAPCGHTCIGRSRSARQRFV